MEEGANSTLSIAKVGPTDSGNYTCQLTTMPEQPATIHVHVLNGEDTFIFPSTSVAVASFVEIDNAIFRVAHRANRASRDSFISCTF